MSEDQSPLDFSAIDPTAPQLDFERRLAGVRRAAGGALARRRAGGTALVVVSRWRLPLMAALFLVMFASLAMLRATQRDPAIDAEPQDEIAAALGLDTPFGSVILSDSLSAADVLLGGFEP
jgi:hypothetical protein